MVIYILAEFDNDAEYGDYDRTLGVYSSLDNAKAGLFNLYPEYENGCKWVDGSDGSSNLIDVSYDFSVGPYIYPNEIDCLLF